MCVSVSPLLPLEQPGGDNGEGRHPPRLQLSPELLFPAAQAAFGTQAALELLWSPAALTTPGKGFAGGLCPTLLCRGRGLHLLKGSQPSRCSGVRVGRVVPLLASEMPSGRLLPPHCCSELDLKRREVIESRIGASCPGVSPCSWCLLW